MKIQIIEKSVSLTEIQRDIVYRRLLDALDRFEGKVRGVTVTLSDINGSRGGVDKLCRLRMLLSENGEIVLSENSESIEAAVSCIADRAANTVQRLVERRRTYQHHAVGVSNALFANATPISA